MKKYFWLLILFLPLLIAAQEESGGNGIEWVQGLSWKEVKAKAKSENKFIFLDCYATWCGPCKLMDKDVYPDELVGKEMNKMFVCVKVQMDKTPIDDEQVKKWYKDASDIKELYAIQALPSFLFLSKEGTPLHKEIGYKNASSFITMVHAALDPKSQYYLILNRFKKGNIDTSEAKLLSKSLMSIDEKFAGELAEFYLSRIPKKEIGQEDNLQLLITARRTAAIEKIAVNYLKTLQPDQYAHLHHLQLFNAFSTSDDVLEIVIKYLKSLPDTGLNKPENKTIASIFKKGEEVKRIADKYINTLPNEKLFTVENIQFLNNFTNTSNDRGFSIFYKNQQVVDSIMNTREKKRNFYTVPRYSQYIVDNIIYRELVRPYLVQHKETGNVKGIPWKKIKHSIKLKYSKALADRIVLSEKVALYRILTQKYNNYWNEYINLSLDLIKKYGTDTTNGYVDATVLNNLCWDGIFLHSTNKRHLKQGIEIMEGVVRRNPNDEAEIDTYANLLYKAGRKKEAIKWEEKALEIAFQKKSEYYIKLFQSNINAMKNEKQLWLMQGGS